MFLRSVGNCVPPPPRRYAAFCGAAAAPRKMRGSRRERRALGLTRLRAWPKSGGRGGTACCPNGIRVEMSVCPAPSPRRKTGSSGVNWNYTIISKSLDSGLRRNDESWLRSFPRSCVGMQTLFLWATARESFPRSLGGYLVLVAKWYDSAVDLELFSGWFRSRDNRGRREHRGRPDRIIEVTRSKSREQFHADVVVAGNADAAEIRAGDVLAMAAAVHEIPVNDFSAAIPQRQVFSRETDLCPIAGIDVPPGGILAGLRVLMREVTLVPGMPVHLFHHVPGAPERLPGKAVVPPETPVFVVYQFINPPGFILLNFVGLARPPFEGKGEQAARGPSMNIRCMPTGTAEEN